MTCIPEPTMQPCDTGHRIPLFDSCRMTLTEMSNTKFSTDSIKCAILLPLTWKGGRAYGSTPYQEREVQSKADSEQLVLFFHNKYCFFFVEPKFLGCIDYQIFLPMVLRCSGAPVLIFYFYKKRLTWWLDGCIYDIPSTAWCSYSWVIRACPALTMWLRDAVLVKDPLSPLHAIESPVALWLEHLTRIRRVVVSNLIWGSYFFRVSIWRQLCFTSTNQRKFHLSWMCELSLPGNSPNWSWGRVTRGRSRERRWLSENSPKF